MTKIHIGKNGKPSQCRATKGNCPFGGEESHYDSVEQATQAYEKQMTQQSDVLKSKAFSKPEISKYGGYQKDFDDEEYSTYEGYKLKYDDENHIYITNTRQIQIDTNQNAGVTWDSAGWEVDYKKALEFATHLDETGRAALDMQSYVDNKQYDKDKVPIYRSPETDPIKKHGNDKEFEQYDDKMHGYKIKKDDKGKYIFNTDSSDDITMSEVDGKVYLHWNATDLATSDKPEERVRPVQAREFAKEVYFAAQAARYFEHVIQMEKENNK